MSDRIVKVVLRGDVAGFKASMAAASKSVSDAADRMTGAEKQSVKFRHGLTAVGNTAGKMGLVAAGGLAAIVAATANFDKKMSGVQAATNETAANMEKLREAAIQAGRDTAYSAAEAADGIDNLARAGVSTSDILAGGLTGALDLAAAGQINVGDAAEYSARAMTQFNLAGDQVPHVADLLAAAAGKAVGEVGDFGQALNQAGLVASQTGLSIEDTVGTLAAFAQAGLQGSDAGTSFKSMLQRLQNPLGQGAETMKNLGINAYDASGNFIGITAVAGQLQEKLGGLSQAQRDAAMAQIFGSDAVRAASILYKEGAEGIQSWIDQTDDAGFAAEQASTKLDNLAGDFTKLKGSLETALVGSGEGAQGPLRSLVQGITDVVNVYNDLPPAAKSTTTAILGVTAAAGGGLWAFSKAVQGAANMKVALKELGPAGTKASAAMKGLGKAVGAVSIAFAGFAVADSISKIGDETLPGIEALTSQLIDLANSNAAAQLSSEFDSLGDSIERLADKNTAQRVNDALADKLGFGKGRSLREAEAEVEALDAALTQMVNNGNADVAAQALENLKAAGVDVDALIPLLTGYGEALTGVENDARLAGSATGWFADHTADSTAAVEDNTDALQDNIDAMRDQRSEKLAALDAEIGYQAALDDARKSLKENGKTLDITTEKGRANKTALLNVAAAWNEQSEAAKNAPGAHKKAIDSFVTLATQMGMDEKKARNLARSILELPDKKVRVTAEVSGAITAMESVRSFLDSLDGKTAHAYVQVSRTGVKATQGYATGGYITGPGTATSDSIPAYLSNGEYVVKAAAVQKYGTAMFDSLNAMRFATGGLVQRFADGGQAKVDAKELRAAWGDFKITVDMDTSDVRRELKALRESIHSAGGTWTAGMQQMADRLIATSRTLDEQREALDESKDALRELREAAKSFRSEVASNFKSDLFGGINLPSEFDALDPATRQMHLENIRRNRLENDIADAESFKAALRAAARKGLDGGLFKELAASGDVAAAEFFAGMNRQQISRYEHLYAERAQAASSVGRYASQQAYGAELRAQTAEVKALRREVRDLISDRTIDRQARANGRETARALDKTAANAQRRK